MKIKVMLVKKMMENKNKNMIKKNSTMKKNYKINHKNNQM